MGDEEHGAGKRLERRLERLARVEVEVVRRLVEDEEVRARGDEDREAEPPPLAAGEVAHLLHVRLPAGEEEAAEERLRLRARETGHGLDAVEDAASLVQLEAVLGEVADLDAVAELVVAGDRVLDQRGLAASVRADEGEMVAALEREGDVVEQDAIRDLDPLVLEDEDVAPAPLRLREVEAEPARPAGEEGSLGRWPRFAPSPGGRSG